MPEDGYAGVGPFLFDHARQQREVIILHQDERFLRVGDLREHGIGKFAVHLLVIFPVLGTKDRPRVRDMAKRPKPFIGKAEVVAVFLFLIEPHAPERILRLGRRHAQAIVLVHGFPIGIAAGLGDPGAIASAQNRLDRSDQAAGGNHDLQIAVLARVNVGLAIRHYYEAPLLQPLAHVHGEPVGSPQRLGGLAQIRFAFGGGTRLVQGLHHAFHFFGQRPQQLASRRRGDLARLPAAQRFQPLRRLGDRAHQAPANHQKRDQHDQQNFQRQVNQRLAPDYRALFADEAGVVKDDEPHRFAVGAAHRKRFRVVITRTHREERPAAVRAFRIDLWRQRGKGIFQRRGQAVCQGHGLAGIIEDGRAHGALARIEAVQRAAQLRCGSVFIQQRLQIVGQALRRQAGALIQLFVQRQLLVLCLIVGKQAGDQRDARDHRKH